MSGITSHILDTSLGAPAAGVPVALSVQSDEGGWTEIGSGQTDADGRVGDLYPHDSLRLGTYRLRYALAPYFERGQRDSFYPHVDVHFRVAHPEQHYHVPLLVSPFGYSTYRGS